MRPKMVTMAKLYVARIEIYSFKFGSAFSHGGQPQQLLSS